MEQWPDAFHSCSQFKTGKQCRSFLETTYSISVEVYQNAVALLFSNITLDIIDYIPHYMPMTC